MGFAQSANCDLSIRKGCNGNWGGHRDGTQECAFSRKNEYLIRAAIGNVDPPLGVHVAVFTENHIGRPDFGRRACCQACANLQQRLAAFVEHDDSRRWRLQDV
jgi:hypothetical protein